MSATDNSNLPVLLEGVANASQFELSIPGLAAGALTVDGFESRDCALSEDYSFDVAVTASGDPQLSRHIGQPATLRLRWSGDRVRVHGVVSAVNEIGASPSGPRYALTVGSPLYRLRERTGSRVFLNKNVKEIVTQVLEDAGFTNGEYAFEEKGELPRREYYVQYQETDLAFIRRALAFDGLFFTFRQTPEHAVLLVHDDLDALSVKLGTVPLAYHPPSGQVPLAEAVLTTRRRAELKTANVRLKDYNYRTPHQALLVETAPDSDIPATGTQYRYGEHFGDDREGRRLARLRQEAIDCQRERLSADSDCRGLLPGSRLRLSGHPDQALNGDWLVLSVAHQGDQRAGESYGRANKRATYRNQLELLRAGTPYRTPVPENPHHVQRTFIAKVEGDGSEYPYLDGMGRYRIRMPFDLGDAPEGQASHPVRMLQPYGGENCGVHYPLRSGTEVAVACVNGDINRPIILGAVANPATPSPVTAENRTQHIFSTWGGNRLLMEDRRGQEHILLATRNETNRLKLDATRGKEGVELVTEQGDMHLKSGKAMLLRSGGDHTVEVGKDHKVTVQGKRTVMTKKGDIEMHAARDLRLKAGTDVAITAESADMDIRSGKNLNIRSGAGATLETRKGDATVDVLQGSFNLKARKNITFLGHGQGVIHIGQNKGAMEIAESGNLTISAPKVEISGETIAVKGKRISHN